MKKIIFIILMLFITLITFSEARLGEFPAGECVDIKTILNSTLVNISTINFPNLTVAVSNQPMNQSGRTFNYSFCDTNTQGVYIYDYFTDEGDVFVNDFLITPSGVSVDTGRSVLYVILLIVNVMFFALFLTLAVTTPYKNIEIKGMRGETIITQVTKSKYVKLVSIWITWGLLLWFVTILTGMTNNYIRFEPLRDLITNLYVFLYYSGYGVGVALIWLLFLNLWKDIILNKTILNEGKAIIRKL